MDLIYSSLVNNILIPIVTYYITPNGAKSLINHAKKKGFHRDVDWWLHEFHETCKSEMNLEINIGWLGWNIY